MAKDLLLEIGMEEVPSKFVRGAVDQLAEKTEKWLADSRIDFGEIRKYGTPRRIAVLVRSVEEKQRDLNEEAKGPSRKIALDENGQWSKAALGFARGQGVEPDDLYFKDLGGVEYVYAAKRSAGQPTESVLGAGLAQIVASMNFPKNMRWGAYDMKFVRPIRWIAALYGNDTVEMEVAGVASGRMTRGHRFLGRETEISSPEQYERLLKEQSVYPDMNERRQMIVNQIRQLAEEKGWTVPIQEDLLEEVLFLVEYPTVLFGTFNPEFLHIPQEVLITSMREHQRYFPVLDKEGKLLPYFVTVRNGNAEHLETVAKGNEKVLRARLSDARFFYEEDHKMTIDSALARLENIVFHEELGTIGDKVRRIQAISAALTGRLRTDAETTAQIVRAAAICKFDLVSQMVYEFPELQGVMGEDYARKLGEPEAIARAVNEHYQPRFSGDAVPASLVGAIVSMADKIDTIAACFAIGIIPSGSQDPYALRRQAAGIVQILLEHRLPLGLSDLFDIAINVQQNAGLLKRDEGEVRNNLYDFFSLRMKNVLTERKLRYDVIDAVLEAGFDNVAGAVNRADELSEAVKDPAFKTAAESFTRVGNLASKAAGDTVEPAAFVEEAERSLYQAWLDIHDRYALHMDNNEAASALLLLRGLEAPITRFFDEVMVMAEDERVRSNRLALLAKLFADIRRFADFSKLVF